MNDKDFFDLLFQQFARTTGAENTFWMPEKEESVGLYPMVDWDGDATPDMWAVYSVDQEQNKKLVGVLTSEADADFITAVHGCLPDLVRRLHDALDEADRLDRERDEAEQNVFRLAVENEELRQELSQLRRERESWVSKAGDALWKIERPM